MSFSSKTKNEIARINMTKKCCQIAELAGFIRMSGSINLSGFKNVNLKLSTENAAVARRIFKILKKQFNSHTEVLVRKNKQLKKNNNYLIVVDDENIAKDILVQTSILNEDFSNLFNINYHVDKKIIEEDCSKRAYLRGVFLGGGSLSDPEKTYHLEFVTRNEEHAKDLQEIMNTYNLKAKIVIRKENYVVYIKESEKIVDFLNIVGAHNALLQLENIRVFKDVRNNVNRVVNCETANMNKTIEAALRQVSNIELIQNTIGIEKLPENLREIAYLRLENKDVTLVELGKMLTIPIGKSGVNHRLRRIEKIADRIREEVKE
ncbi:DNA-binding protein WhiA [Clostridiaceae bacterium M8S5]|nr:DNA-binding protein WhiA [Clostridiaceae bacterium M8S5]